jgi:ribosomal-protein-alanine N-acetyltransferase
LTGGHVLETERLLLRELVPEDVDWMHPIFSDPETMRFYPAPFAVEQTRSWIAWGSGTYASRGFGLWAVVRKDDGVPLGDCGITLQPVEGADLLEVGYHLRRDQWGHGYASEAARAVRDHAFAVLDALTVVSIVAPANVRSRGVASRIHPTMREFVSTRTGETLCLYVSQRTDWLAEGEDSGRTGPGPGIVRDDRRLNSREPGAPRHGLSRRSC